MNDECVFLFLPRSTVIILFISKNSIKVSHICYEDAKKKEKKGAVGTLCIS
jgi:hypothetical protein